jgi:hypothetical protein
MEPRWRRRGLVVRNGLASIASLAVVLGATVAVDPASAGASSPADQGVTSTTIRIGFPVINFPALAAVGVHLNDGNFQHAISALTANMNAHGGIDGRRIVPYIALDNPAITASSQTVCTQLTEDDHVFVAIAPVYPDCYQATHDTPVIDGTLPGTLPASAAVDFTLTPPDEAYDPIQFAAFKKAGVFDGKKVGIYYGSGVDGPEARSVQSDLKKLHVDVVQMAGDDAPAADTTAVDQDTQTIALRFKSEGVNEVIAVGGSGATDWPRALDGIQSTYKPPWIATNYTSISSDIAAAKGGNPYYDNVMTSDPSPSIYQAWQDPAIQKCYKIVHKAYPSDPISPPPSPKTPAAAADSSNATYAAVVSVCATLGIVAAIADHAGKDLTVASFTKAGYGLRNVTLPGSSEPVSFGPNQPYPLGHPHLLVYSTKLGTLVPAPA